MAWLSWVKSMTSFLIKGKTETGLGNVESYRWICSRNLFVSAAHTVPPYHPKCLSVCNRILREYVRRGRSDFSTRNSALQSAKFIHSWHRGGWISDEYTVTFYMGAPLLSGCRYQGSPRDKVSCLVTCNSQLGDLGSISLCLILLKRKLERTLFA